MKVYPVGAMLFHVDRRADMMKLTVTFGNFVNAPKREILISPLINCRSGWDQTFDFVKIWTVMYFLIFVRTIISLYCIVRQNY